jgi:hypothetical protein
MDPCFIGIKERNSTHLPVAVHCSFQILPVTRSFSSFLSPPEKNKAMLR